MKKFTKATLIIVLGIILCMLCACKPGTNTPPDNEKETFTVNFIVDGEAYKTATSDQNGKVVLPENPETDETHVFDGWFTDEAFSVPFTSDTVVSENISVYAKISRKVFSVSFIVGGEAYKTATSDQNGKVTLPENPTTDETHVFDGWFTDEAFSVPFTADTVVSENISVYAKISRKVFTVSFIVNGETYKTATSDQNGKVVLPENPETDETHVFDGWFTDEAFSVPFTSDTVVNENISVYAKISRKVFTVNFIVDGEAYKTATSDQSGKVVLPENPTTDETHVFDGWFTDEAFSVPFTADTVVNENTNVYAKISRKVFTVNFIVDEQTYASVEADENGNIQMPDEPALGAGYIFEGWFTDNGVWQNGFDAQAPVTRSIDVFAKLYKYVLNPAGNASIGTLETGSKVWSSNDYTFTSLPKSLIGNPYILWTINGPNTATAIKSGWVYAITGEALNFGHEASQVEVLDGYNFTMLEHQYWNIWSASLKNNIIFEKYVEPGETFTLGRWSVLIMSDQKLDLEAGEPIEKDENLAVLAPSSGDYTMNMALSAKVFTDRAQYTFYDMPYWLAGKNYIQNAYGSKTHSATVTKSGFVYMLTSKAGNISLVNSLTSAGWSNVTDTIPENLNLFGDSTQKGAFLNDTYKGFALLKKHVEKGDVITWAQWGIPVFSGELTLSENLAKFATAADTTKAAKAQNEMRLFSDRTYYAMNGIPAALDGLTYYLDGIVTGATVKAVSAGKAYLLIPSGTKAYEALEKEVIAAGWTVVQCKPFRPAVGLLFNNRLYQKEVAVGEQIHFGKYNLIFGASQDSQSDYYVMPSLTTAADVILNPTSDLYDINKQNWLGCPTVEKTSGGRVWSGWFTGGKRELGTGNYAIINYSDDDCKTWKKALAVVHPDPAVQVTKPELWTAPNGDLWLFWIQHTGTGNFDGKMGTWASVCKNPDDAAPEWSTPKRLTDGYMRSKPIIINRDGKTEWLYAAFDWMQPHYTRVYASADGGENWSFRGKAECLDTSSGKNNLDDPALVQKPDGSLWLLMRPSAGTNVYESFSYDGGYTWTHARASSIEGPQSRFTVDLLSDGKMLMVFHDAATRTMLTAYLSVDGGKSWQYKLLIDQRSYVSYPDTIITSDGTIYVIYDRNRTTDREIYMTTFTVGDVVAGKYESDKSRPYFLVDKTRPA